MTEAQRSNDTDVARGRQGNAGTRLPALVVVGLKYHKRNLGLILRSSEGEGLTRKEVASAWAGRVVHFEVSIRIRYTSFTSCEGDCAV